MPERLSEVGIFLDLKRLTPASGIFPYEVNSPLWSDGLHKRRWLALPDGKKIDFKWSDPWAFPEMTALIKHFETVG